MLIVLEDGVAYDYFTEGEAHKGNKELLESLLSQAVEKEIKVTIQPLGRTETFEEHYADLSALVHMDIEVEE